MKNSLDDQSASFSYSEFTPVKKRRTRKNKKLKDRPSAALALQRIQEELRKDDWFLECSQILSKTWTDLSLQDSDILCLGLGSPANSRNSCLQLAFLVETCRHLKLTPERVSVYDPVFTEEDMTLFQDLQIRVLTENKNGEYPLSLPTVCLMLHCDMRLYESLLKANWTRVRLCNVILIGNRLADYIDSNPSQKLEIDAPCMLRVAPLLETQQLPASSSWPTAFSNTCVQYLPSSVPVDEKWFISNPSTRNS